MNAGRFWFQFPRGFQVGSWLSAVLFVGQPVGLYADFLDDISASAIIAYESEYVFRGEKKAGDSVQPSLEVGYPIGPGDAYAGVWASSELVSDPFEEVNLYAGYQLPLSPIFSVGGGFTFYWYPDSEKGYSNEEEPFLGLYADLPLSPSLVGYYNFELEQTLLQLSVYEDYWFTDSVGIEGGLIFGLGYAGNGNARSGTDKSSQGFGYAIAYANLVFAWFENSSISVGARYSGRRDDSYSDFLYWGGSLSIWL